MSVTSPEPSSDPVRLYPLLSALSKLRQQNALLTSEYTDLKSRISTVLSRLTLEGRKLSRAGVDCYPEKESQRRLLESAKRQLEQYSKEHSVLKRKIESRCTLQAVIDVEDSIAELEQRLQEAEFENKELKRLQRVIDREEKHVFDPVSEISHAERQVEMYLRKVRDLEEAIDQNIPRFEKSEKRLLEAEKQSKLLENVKIEAVQSKISAKVTNNAVESGFGRIAVQNPTTGDRKSIERTAPPPANNRFRARTEANFDLPRIREASKRVKRRRK